MRTVFRAAGVAAGISISFSSASAEVEEISGQDGSISNYSRSSLGDLGGNFLINNDHMAVEQSEKLFILYNSLYSNDRLDTNATVRTDKPDQPASLDNFGEVFIPSYVWSLDTIHLDPVSGEFGLEVADQQNINNWWAREIIGLLIDNITDTNSEIPSQFQMISCGDNGVENNYTEYCSSNYQLTNQYTAGHTEIIGVYNSNYGAIAPNNDNYPVVKSKATSTPIETSDVSSTFIQENQSGAVRDLSPLMPAGVNSVVLQGHVVDRNDPSDQCDDAYSPCTDIKANQAVPEIDPSIQIGSPGPVIRIDDPGPFSHPLPIFTPPPIASSVPETSTWIMMIIGFGFIIAAYERSSRNLVKLGLVGISFNTAKNKSFSLLWRLTTFRVTNRQRQC
jgi:hypothetical protein